MREEIIGYSVFYNGKLVFNVYIADQKLFEKVLENNEDENLEIMAVKKVVEA